MNRKGLSSVFKNVYLSLLLSSVICVDAIADSLEEKIQAANAKIKEQESQQVQNDKELQKLVDEYNELIRQKEQEAGKVEHIEVPSQSLDEALMQRMKEYENKLDQFDVRLKNIENKLGIIDVTKPGIVALDVPQHTTGSVQSNNTHVVTPTPALHKKENTHEVDEQETKKAEKQPVPSLGGTQSVAAQFNQASLFLKSQTPDDLKKAVAAFEDIINEFPDDEFAHKSYLYAGEATLHLKDYEKAEKYYESAIIKPLPEFLIVEARLGYAKTLSAQNKKDVMCKQLSYLKGLHMNDLQKKEHHALMNQCKTK